jgi:hypothetical protein
MCPLSSSTLSTCHLLMWTTRALLSRDPLAFPPSILSAISGIISAAEPGFPPHILSQWSTQSPLRSWSDLYVLGILSLLSRDLQASASPHEILLLSQSVNVLLASMIDILSSDSPSLQYLPTKPLLSPLSVYRHVSVPDHSNWNSQTFLRDFLSAFLSPQETLSVHQILKQFPSPSQATLLLTVLGLPTTDQSLSQSSPAEERFRFALQGLEFQLPLPATSSAPQPLLSDEFLLLKLRSRSLTSLAAILSQCSDSPNKFSSLLSPHLSSLIPALLKVSVPSSLTQIDPHITPLPSLQIAQSRTASDGAALVRSKSLELLAVIAQRDPSPSSPVAATLLPYSVLFPFQAMVVKGLGDVLGDKKRAVRILAASVRNQWISLKR